TASFSYQGTTPKIQSVSYDNAGNELTGGFYSARNLLQSIVESEDAGQPHSVRYAYDGRDIRVATTANVGLPQPIEWGFVYSPELNLLARSEPPPFMGELLDGVFNGTDYIWMGGQPVAQASSDP